MSTLLLRLAGPMQSWGTDSRFDIRFTGREPSKSGVVGLFCAALGKPRAERPGETLPSLAQLTGLRFGVRSDRAGRLQVDYQTAGGTHRLGDRYGVINASGKQLSTVQSRRYYLADADFLAALEGSDELLQRLDAALAQPVWQLCLGRKAFVPGEPVRLPDAGPDSRWWGMSLEAALSTYPWRRRSARDEPPKWLVLDAAPNDTTRQLRYDVPLDFTARRFGPRHVTVMRLSEPPPEVSDVSLTTGTQSVATPGSHRPE